MEKSIFVRIGLAMEAVDVVSKDTFKLEAHTFIEAVKLSLNAIVPGDFNVEVGEMHYGFYVSVSTSDDSDKSEIAYITQHSDKSEAEAEEEIASQLCTYIQHVKDMVEFYGMHFGGCLLLTID